MKKILTVVLFLSCVSFVNAQNLNVSDEITKNQPEQVQSIEIYKNNCTQKVWDNWTKSNIKHDDATIKITFKTLQDGTIQDLDIEIPSKFEQNNQAAIKAIENAAPFEGFPADINAKYAEHVMLFPCKRYAQITPFKQD